MSSAIDTNVILELIGGAQDSAEHTQILLERESRRGGLVISAPVYAECLAHPGWRQADLNAFLREARISVDWELSDTVWIDAGLVFAEYGTRRRQQSQPHPRRLLIDFVVGAHAGSVGALITYDSFFRSYFPKLDVIDE